MDNYTRKDIPVLGRFVSMSSDNTVASAQQVWDDVQEENQLDINQNALNRLKTLEDQGGLSAEYKNILDYFINTSNLSDYNTGNWDGYGEIFKSHGTQVEGLFNFYNCVIITKDYSSYDDRVGYSLRVEGGPLGNRAEKALYTFGDSAMTGRLTINLDDSYQNGNYYALVVNGKLWADSDVVVDGLTYLHDDVNVDGKVISDYIEVEDPSTILFRSENNSLQNIIDDINRVIVWDCYVTTSSALNEEDQLLQVDFADHTIGELNDIINSGKTIILITRPLGELASHVFYTFYLDHVFGQPLFICTSVNIFDSTSLLLSYIALPIYDGTNYDTLLGTLVIRSTSTPTMSNIFNKINAIAPIYKQYISDTGRLNIGMIYDSRAFTTVANPATLTLKTEYLNLPTSKQDLLVSGTNIKTINGKSILGSGNLTIQGSGGSGNVVDDNYVHTDNNFTTELMSKLQLLPESAEENVQSDWNVNDDSSDAYILNKPDLSIYALNDDISILDNITDQDIENWNRKLNPETSMSGYGILYDTDVFKENSGTLTLADAYSTAHPVKMTSSGNWSSSNENAVPTVAAVYNKFLTKDDTSVVKTSGGQQIGGVKTFTSYIVAPGVKAGNANNLSSSKLFATDGSIVSLKTIINKTGEQSIFGTEKIDCTYSNFTAPTSSVVGTSGLVPAPAIGTQNYILSASGWINPNLIVEDEVTVVITPTDANIITIMTLAANMNDTMYNAAYRLNTNGFTFTIDGQQYSYNQISQMKRSKLKFEFSDNFAYDADAQSGFYITSYKFIPYDHSDMLVIYAIRDDDEAFVFSFASNVFMFGALGPDLQYNKLKIKYNATDSNNRLFSVLSEFYLVFGMKSDIIDLVSNKLIYDATPVVADLQYATDNIAFYGLIGSTNMADDDTGLSFSALPEYGLVEYRNGVLVI